MSAFVDGARFVLWMPVAKNPFHVSIPITAAKAAELGAAELLEDWEWDAALREHRCKLDLWPSSQALIVRETGEPL